MNLFFIFIAALVLSLILHPAAIKISQKYNLFDNPHRDQIHKNPTPVLGGVAMSVTIFIVVMMARMLGLCEWNRIFDGILVGSCLIVLVGFIDDRFGMNPAIKLAGQFIAAGMFLIFTEASIGLFHPLVEFFALLVGLVSMMNAFNILDNMDGVTGSMSFAIGLSFLSVAVLSQEYGLAVIIVVVLGAIGGFLRYNLPRAKIFMGDAGAMFLGFFFGALAIVFLINHRSYYLYTTPFLILSYPIFDIALVSLSRMREKRSLSVAAPDSSPYRFVRWVFTTKNAYLAVFAINLIMGAFGVITYIFRDNPVSVILIFAAGLSLSVLGVHLYRNFLYFIERTLFFIVDLFSINLAFYFLYALKYKFGLMPYEIFIPYAEMLAPAVWASLFWVLLFSVMGIYEIRPNKYFSTYLKALVRIIFAGMLAFVIAIISLEGKLEISTVPIIVYVALLFIFNMVFKYCAFAVSRWLGKRKSRRPRVALYVKDTHGNMDEILKTTGNLFNIVGYIGEPNPQAENNHLLYLGEVAKLGDIIHDNRLEKIILIWPHDNYDNFMSIIQSHHYLENEFLIIGTPPDVFTGFKTCRLYNADLTKVSSEILRTWEWMAKRGLDIIISLFVLLISSPIFIIKLVSAKINKQPFLMPINYCGRDGKIIKTYAFAEPDRDYGKLERIPLGLPAFITVIKGHLSLVGIIPFSVEMAERQNSQKPGFWRRYLIKPGIWVPAHLKDDDNYFKYELRYMQKMSILLDIYWIIVGMGRSILTLRKI